MANQTMTTFAAALKTLYPYPRVEQLVLRKHPFLAMVSKSENFGGENLVIPTHYEDVAGASRTFATARSLKAPSKKVKFTLTRVKDYAVAAVDNEVIEASRISGNAGAFQEALKSETDSAFEKMGQRLASSIFRGTSGSLGQIHASSGTGTSLRLANPGDVVHYGVGDALVFALAESTAGLRSATALGVTAIDRDTGYLTLDATLAGKSVAAGDYIFKSGDRNAAMAGLEAWCPATAPDSTSFFGVDRSPDVTRLGGVRYDGSDMNIVEALEGAADRLDREGSTPDVCFLPNAKYTELKNFLGTKVEYDSVTAWNNAKISFKAITVGTSTGEIRVIADPFCQAGVGWMLQLDVWKMHSLGKAPHISGLTIGGSEPILLEGEDARELRVVMYGNLGCKAPGKNARITLP